MPMNAICYKNLTIANDELMHFGVIGMHWGIRRFQPYGQGYDPDHEGKEIGLAARLAGRTGSYSDAIRRGSSVQNRAKSAFKAFGRKAASGTNEVLERLNYASDKFGKGVKRAVNSTRSGLAKYAAGYDTDFEAKRMYENASVQDLARGVLSTFGSRAKQKVSDIGRTSWNDVKSAMGEGASRFQDSMAKTKIASKQFSTNARASMALLTGAMDPRSSASQILEGREKQRAYGNKTSGAIIGAKNMLDLRDLGYKKPSTKKLSETLFGKPGKPYSGDFSPYDLSKMGSKTASRKLLQLREAYDKAFESERYKKKYGQGIYQTSQLGYDRIGRPNYQSSDRLDLKSRDKQLQEFGDYISRVMSSANKQTNTERFMLSAREGLQLLDAAVTPAAMGARVDSDYFKNMTQMEKRLLGF